MLEENIPKVIEFDLKKNSSDFGWSDYYGANFVASNYCGIKEKTNVFFWHHGLVSPWESLSFNHVVFNLKNKRLNYFVSSKSQCEILKKNGFVNVKAIGLPIVYVNKPQVKRIPNSLLIMPSHSLVGQMINNKQAMQTFVKTVEKYKSYFSKIGVCLHKNDFENNYWVDEFKKIGLEIYLGAQNNDKNTYYRQSFYYSMYETVFTNDFGSHVAYALFFGCKVSISDLSISLDLLYDGTWNRNPDSINHFYSEDFLNLKELYLKKFYVNPFDAVSDVELGKELVGYYYKVSPFKMRVLFGWSLLGKVFWVFKNMHYDLNIKTRIRNLFSK
jgi:hypothetical protein